MTCVFVYGTLLSNEPNNHLLKTSKLLGDSKVSGLKMYDLGPFPACIVSPEISEVLGEVWEIDDKTFQRLDYLEGFPNFYNRTLVDTKFGEAWVYIHNEEPNGEYIPSGNWKNHLGKEG